MIEEWRSVVGYEGLYEVSNLSRVKSLARTRTVHSKRWRTTFTQEFPEKILRPQLGSNGRYHYALYRNGKCEAITRASIVARAWVPGYREGYEVNHKDENGQNDTIRNLEWCSHRDNMRYGTRTERATRKMIEKVGRRIGVYSPSGVLLSIHRTIADACIIYGAQHENVSKCCRGKIRSHKGYIWRYL